MDKSQLQRGQDILSEISELKSALTQLNADNFFKITAPSCMREESNPFLVVFNLQMKEVGVTSIHNRISDLEKEFKSL
jgi:hypothetical protein